MSQVKIMIVEDDLIIATDIQEQLEEAGYVVTGIATSYEEAVQLFQQSIPDLILLDIQLEGQKDGIVLASKLNTMVPTPVIYLTGNSDDSTLLRAKRTRPLAFLVKPFRDKEFLTNIDLAIDNFCARYRQERTPANTAIYLPSKDQGHEKVLTNDILFAEGEGSYVTIHARNQQTYLVTTNLATLMRQMDTGEFVRISKKHMINLYHIDRLDKDYVKIDEQTLAIGDHYRKELMQNLIFIRTKL